MDRQSPSANPGVDAFLLLGALLLVGALLLSGVRRLSRHPETSNLLPTCHSRVNGRLAVRTALVPGTAERVQTGGGRFSVTGIAEVGTPDRAAWRFRYVCYVRPAGKSWQVDSVAVIDSADAVGAPSRR